MSTRASPVSAGSASSSSYPCVGRSRRSNKRAGSLKRSTRARTPQCPGRTVRQVARHPTKQACAVCERTLLTGERALRFSPNGEDFVDVCPLCQDLAVEHGWIKEGSPTSPTVPNQRRRRRRGLASLFDLGR